MSEQKFEKNSTASKSINILKGIKFIIISYMVSIVLILGLTALVVYTDVPEKAGSIGAGVITYFGSFFSAYLYGKSKKRRGMLNGAVNGGLNIAGLFILGLAIYGCTPPLKIAALKIAGGCLSGALGGILGVNSVKE